MRSSRSPSPYQASSDGKFHWDQGLGQFRSDTKAIAITPSSEGGRPGDIQKAIDELGSSGGMVLIRNGTYLMDADVVLPSNVTLRGETSGGVILDFQNREFQVKCEGTLIYNSGTVAVTNGSTTVTGTDTAWTDSLIGYYILLSGIYYLITAVGSTTSLTIEVPFEAVTISSKVYVIVDPKTNILLKDFTVQNSTHPNGAVSYRYLFDVVLDGVSVLDSTIGMNFRECWSASVIGFLVSGCGTGVNVSNCGTWTFYEFEVYGCTGKNMVIDSLINASISNFTQSSSTDTAIYVTNSSNWGLYDFTIMFSGGKGIEILSSNYIAIFGANIQNSTSDGIKLTSTADRIGISNVVLNSNGGYGINIAASSCDDNTITSCFFVSNTSGTINDLGTTTISANNQT